MQTAPTTGTRRPPTQHLGAPHVARIAVGVPDGQRRDARRPRRAPQSPVADRRRRRDVVHGHDARAQAQRRLAARPAPRAPRASRRRAPARAARRRAAPAGNRTAAALLAAWLHERREARAARARATQASKRASASLGDAAGRRRSADAKWVQSPASSSDGSVARRAPSTAAQLADGDPEAAHPGVDLDVHVGPPAHGGRRPSANRSRSPVS